MRVVYVSYDGALDPLGRSQVVPYILQLRRHGIEIALITFEKRERWNERNSRTELGSRLRSAGIKWRPFTYHRRPRLLATAFDIWTGRRAIAAEARRLDADLVHCRADVAMFMARTAKLSQQTRLLYDVRGLFADERAESGSWAPGGLLDRLVRRAEARNLSAAHGLVVLTEAARRVLAERRADLPPHRIIPTCVDLSLFIPGTRREDRRYALAYTGSLGGSYMAQEMVAFARVASELLQGRILFLTPHIAEAAQAGATVDWADVRAVSHETVPAWLRQAKAAFFFYRPTSARRGTCPTKLGEALAAGLPIVANPGIGDLDRILTQERVGVFVHRFDRDAYTDAVRRLRELMQDPTLGVRCRQLAERRFSLEAGVAAYAALYQEIARQPQS